MIDQLKYKVTVEYPEVGYSRIFDYIGEAMDEIKRAEQGDFVLLELEVYRDILE